MPNAELSAVETRSPPRAAAGGGAGARSAEPGTVAVCFVNAALEEVRTRRLDEDALLAKVGLSAQLVRLPQARVSAKQYGALWRLVALTLDDEFFGQDSRRMKSGSFAMLCHTVIHCRTLVQGIERSLRFYRLVLDDIGGTLVRDGALARIELRARDGVERRSFAHEILLMLLHGVACWLVNRRIPILRAQFAFPEPAHSAEYRLMYCTLLRFDAACTAIEFDSAYLDLPVVQDERSAKEFLRTAPENIIVKYKNASSVGARIRRRLRQALPGSVPEFATIARELRMTPATLRRRLHEEGASFRSIKDGLRRDLAVRYLTHSARSVMDIALELGFSERSSFHRAFRKWTGASPGEFRQRDGAGL
ncbi:MAG TPA: AraC family transcriptional regulator [Steroidobacteraceae bacterium]|nr:AraC family transcriptional regulator [Steroidobacteraceae bacterium]